MIDELRHFLLVVEHGTVTEAARHAHLSQPALSASLRRLEDYFGAPLLFRGRAGATPTAAGAALVPRAEAVLAALGDARRAVAEIEGLSAGEVRVGASGTAATYLLPEPLSRYRKLYPNVRIVLRELGASRAAAGVERGDLDLAVVSDPAGELWMRDEFVLVGSRKVHSLDAPFVTFSPETTTRQNLDKYFPDANIVMELGSIAAVKRHVRAGIGIALLSRAAVQQDIDARRLVVVRHDKTPIPRELRLVHRGEELLSPPPLRCARCSWSAAQSGAPNTGLGNLDRW